MAAMAAMADATVKQPFCMHDAAMQRVEKIAGTVWPSYVPGTSVVSSSAEPDLVRPPTPVHHPSSNHQSTRSLAAAAVATSIPLASDLIVAGSNICPVSAVHLDNTQTQYIFPP